MGTQRFSSLHTKMLMERFEDGTITRPELRELAQRFEGGRAAHAQDQYPSTGTYSDDPGDTWRDKVLLAEMGMRTPEGRTISPLTPGQREVYARVKYGIEGVR